MDGADLLAPTAAAAALMLWLLLFLPLLWEQYRGGGAGQPPRPSRRPALPPLPPPAAALPLPERAVVDCRWYGSVFGGLCRPEPGRHSLQVRGVAWRGETHVEAGDEGQDAAGAAWDDTMGVLFVAVADGLGSLPRSGAYAVHAVTAALQLCRTRGDDRPFAHIGDRLFGAVAAGLRRSFGPEAGVDGGTTLVVAEVVPDAHGARVTVHGVGDSEAWVLSAGRWRALHHERDPAEEENATRDLPTFCRPRSRTERVPPGGMLLLATDGFACRIDSTAGRSPWLLAERLRRTTSPMGLAHLVAHPENDDEDDRGVVAVWVS
ncbi:protein phosphatase 2C domain-containing protein [Actinoplanes teichomyceticus]|uniref:Serine/threonine protein phosphatase PrpC n=1 Tax=Actinoplanes teichomyceticus TaxID=1867 RepID=A0A561WKT1_ACTTI|nr:protein phosphatase 2C domain-containing protein [Actinoplanes teichomyceticus]TWG24464.1 serine/threonine protein phosphatase PrpC [Actinoplanes teichomyceticus]GIF12685.1 hypothetical protein Ate01nite_27170 [Actinoplanes teichomyceticus]